MPLNDGQIKAYNQAEADASKLAKLMMRNYKQAESEIIAEIEKVYAKYLASENPADYYNIMIKFDRLNSLLKQTQDIYLQYANKAGIDIEQISSIGISNNYYYNEYVFSWYIPAELGIKFNFSFIDPRLVELSVTNSAEAWKNIPLTMKNKYGKLTDLTSNAGTLKKILQDNKIEDLAKIQQAITQGFIQGKTLPKVSKDISNVMANAGYKADRIARTEFTRTSGAGQYIQSIDAQSKGVIIKRKWLATLDNRTRHNHAALDGQTVEIGQYFKIAGDQALYPGNFNQAKNSINCRCRVIDVIEGAEPKLRTGRNPVSGENETFTFKTFNQWAKENNLKRNKFGELLPA